MRKFKVLKAALFLFAMLFAVTSVAYSDNSTPKFTDISGNWAEQHIINVYNKGLMGGVSDTQFKPGDNVKNYDALVSISRMIKREKNINLEQLAEKYQTSVIEKFNVPEYAREAVLICLGEGVITDADISMFNMDEYAYAKKNNIVKYLGMVFGVKYDEKAPPVVLAFKDSMFIPSMYRPYVKFLIDNGVINASGDENGKFNPDSFIKRAEFAKMLDIASDVYKKKMSGNDTALPNTDTASNDTSSGVILPDAGVSNPPVVIDDGMQPEVTAYVDEVIPEYGTLAVFVGTERRVYKVADNAVCTIDDVPAGYWKLKKSDMVKLYIEGGKVVKIIGESKIRKVVGKLSGIQTGDATILTMKTLSGETRTYTITAKTIVIKDGRSALWQELREGNDLVLTTSYDELIEINADGVKSTDKGVIESIVYSRMAPPKFVITAPDGRQNAYYAKQDMEISGAGSDVYYLRPGMQVDVSLIDDEISKLAVINETAAVQATLKGMIKSIDTVSRVLVIEVFDISANKYTDKKIFVTEETKIGYVDMDSFEIKPLELGSLKVNQTINVTGTGSVDGIFAKTIQLVQ